jgi:hypothetical protein
MGFGVEGQFYLNFKVGNNDDFLDKDDFILFTVYEYAGNVLPTFIWSFRTQNESVITRLNEGNLIQAQYGRNRDDLVDVELSISSINTSKDGADFTVFNVSGYAGRLNYITNHNLRITSAQSGIATAIQVAQANGLTIFANRQTSLDSQKWIQPNNTDKAFVNSCYLHSDVGDSAVTVALTADGKFILKDVLQDLNRNGNQRFDWKFTKDPLRERDIVYNPDGTIETQSGFINNWIGYGREIKLIQQQLSEVRGVLDQPQIVLSLSNQVDKLTSVDDRYGGSKFINDNVHTNFWDSYNHNLIFLANLSKINNTFSVSDRYFTIKPLDLCMYAEEASSDSRQSSDFKSGLYYATGVIRSFQAERIDTTMILNREAFNEVRVDSSV